MTVKQIRSRLDARESRLRQELAQVQVQAAGLEVQLQALADLRTELAGKRAAAPPPSNVVPIATAQKRKLSEKGRRAISRGAKKRWRAVRAAKRKAAAR